MRSIRSLQDVVDWGLCIGCGACYSVCEKGAVELINVEHIGIRPKIKSELCNGCTACLVCCPGNRVDASRDKNERAGMEKDSVLIGPTFDIWEGFSTDPEIRYCGSSGGLLTALSLYCLEKESMKFVLHIGMDTNMPWMNRTVMSRTREELLSRTGSRYAVSSPCDSLKLIEESDRPCVFIGKPCDTAAVQALRKVRPQLDANLGLVLTFCCAGVPSTRGSLDLLEKLDLEKDKISHISYRGNGWPGGFTVCGRDGEKKQFLPYMESWHFLQKYRSFRCKLCPDGLGEVCDLSCGDAWHKYTKDTDDPGLSLVMTRSRHGQEMVRKAMAAGYLTLRRSNSASVIKAQGLVERRMEIFGRQLAMKLLMIPTTQFIGFRLLGAWLKAPIMVKIKSFGGTLRRLIQRGLWHRNPVFPN